MEQPGGCFDCVMLKTLYFKSGGPLSAFVAFERGRIWFLSNIPIHLYDCACLLSKLSCVIQAFLYLFFFHCAKYVALL